MSSIPRHLLCLLVIPWEAGSAPASDLQALLSQYSSGSPALAALQSEVESMQQEAKGASAFPAPAFSLEWGNRAVSPGTSNRTMYYEGIALEQEVPYPGKRASAQGALEGKARIAQADYHSTRRDGAYRIASEYLDLYEVRQEILLLDSNLAILQSTEDAVQRRLKSGDGVMADVFRLRTEIARLKNNRLERLSQHQVLFHRLQADVGVTDSIALPDTITFSMDADLPPLDSILALALHRPELEASEALRQMAGQEAESARLARMPNLMVSGRYMTMMGPDEWSVMAGIQVPIAPWSVSGFRAQQSAAQARVHKAQSTTQAATIQVTQETRQAFARYQAARERSSEISREQTEAARNAVQTGLTSYASGSWSLASVLDAMRSLLEAQDAALRTHLDMLRSVAALEYSAGASPGTWLRETTRQPEKNL